MRWNYKTVYFQLKKEGFLGNAFLDEAEVEESLNEYGQAGWELVSMLETDDGLIAIFKKPLDEPVVQQVDLPEEIPEETKEENYREEDVLTEDDIIEAFETVDYIEDDKSDKANENNDDEGEGLQSIRIE